jgi:hypothetical protein
MTIFNLIKPMGVLNHFVKISCISLLLAFLKIAWSQDKSLKSDSVAAAHNPKEAALDRKSYIFINFFYCKACKC